MVGISKKISKTDYEWYIKPHPHSLPELIHLDKFLLDTPEFKIPKIPLIIKFYKGGLCFKCLRISWMGICLS